MKLFDAGNYPARFARRLIGWFTLATALPVLVLSTITYYQMNSHLEREASQRLHRVAKTVGLYLYARLEGVHGRLDQLTAVQAAAAPPAGVRRIVAIQEGDSRKHVPAQAGRLLSPTPLPGSGTQLLLAAASWRQGEDAGHAALLDPDYLKPPPELLPADVDYCVLDGKLSVLMCSGAFPADLHAPLSSARAVQSTGNLAWASTTGDSGRANYWSVFLQEKFAVPDWTVVTMMDDRVVHAPLRAFREVLPRILLLAFLLALLLAVIQIRMRLRPIGELLQATRRFADGDFHTRLQPDSGDELSLIADAFNDMARQTDTQFKRLDGLAALDRSILASFDEERIVDIALDRLSELVACTQVAFLDPVWAHDCVKLSVNRTSSCHGDRRRTVQAPEECVTWLGRIDGPVSFTADELQRWPLLKNGAQTLYPVCRDGQCFGAILVVWASAQQEQEFTTTLEEFSNRLAVALSNAAWEGELFHQAHYDHLTGLANRTLLTDRLDQALRRADRSSTQLAVLFVDLDGFKTINDTLGHKAGDDFLVTAGGRLIAASRSPDAVMRFGGDEFVVLVTDLKSDEDLILKLTTLAERMIAALSEPVELSGRQVSLGASIGIAVYPGDGGDGSELLRNADTAMYHAKTHGRGHPEFYAEVMNRDALERLALKQDLAAALRNNTGLVVEYQPQVCARTGRVMGLEALVRWKHPTLGQLSPGLFVPIAEESGLVLQLGAYVLREACRTFRDLIDLGVEIPRLAVNVAPSQFWAEGFSETVRDALHEADLPADKLELEVTEQTVMRDLESGKALLGVLGSMGVQLSVDDFGTGYSSLSYLQHLPLHALKIDQSFIDGLGKGDASEAIVAAIITLGKRLGLRLIAEGVEQEEQAAILRQLGCDEFQGYMFSGPLARMQLIDWYRDHIADHQDATSGEH